MGLLVPDSALPLEDSEPPVALAPPLELSLPPEPASLPPAEDSPEGLLEPSLVVPPEGSSLPLELASVSGAPVVLEPVVEALVVAVVALVLVRVASLSAVVLLGGVISGVLRGVASETLLPPQAFSDNPQRSATALAPMVVRKYRARGASLRHCEARLGAGCLRGALAGGAHAPSGPIRRPQVGQSLRSLCAICWHQGQKRRCSTAHGRREVEGASGSSLPTTSSVSPVSRSA